MPWEKFVSVACTTSTGIDKLPAVRSNHFEGIYLLLSKLSKLGAQSIGIAITESDDLRVQRSWSTGIYRFCQDNPKSQVHLLRLPFDNDQEAFTAWFKRFCPDVLVGVHPDIQALPKSLGLTAGIDIAYASLNVLDEELGAIAGIYQDPGYLGRRAITYISKKIYDQSLGLPEHTESISVESRFVEGASLQPLLKKTKKPKKKLASKKRASTRSKIELLRG